MCNKTVLIAVNLDSDLKRPYDSSDRLLSENINT